ncbi:hypothetical protein [Microbacterium sp. GXF7504]
MSDAAQSRHDDDARPDDAPPTDAVTDEVREAAASAEQHADTGSNGEATLADAETTAGPNADADEIASSQAQGAEEQGDA